MEAEPKEEPEKGSGLALATNINELTEDIVAKVISFTTPLDAARVSLVSKLFKSAADLNPVWETFLPSDYVSLIPSSSLDLPKKEQYINLCDHQFLIDDGRKSFSLDKRSGKKCYSLAPRDLYIYQGHDPRCWEWISPPESRFPEVAEVMSSNRLEICGTISTRMLSPETFYTVYFVFNLRVDAIAFEYLPLNAVIEPMGDKSHMRTVRKVMLDYGFKELPEGIYYSRKVTNEITSSTGHRKTGRRLKLRPDGWMEIVVGEFYNKGDTEEEFKMIVQDRSARENTDFPYCHYTRMAGLIVQGFEIRPKRLL